LSVTVRIVKYINTLCGQSEETVNQRWLKKKVESTFLSNAPQLPKEQCFLEGFQASPVCSSGKNNTQMKMEKRWNDTDRGIPKTSEKNECHCHFRQHKPRADSPVNEPRPPQ
jgi:hypothetical protein